MSDREATNVVTSENLVEWNMNRLGLATDDAPVEAEEVEETPESEPIEEAQGESEQENEPETKATEERKQNPKLEKRFSELTKARKQAEENAAKSQAEKEALEARLREYEGRSTQQKQVDPIGVEPKADQFDDAFEYAKALAEWSTEKALYERDKQDADRRLDEERSKVLKAWNEKIEKAKVELPDFDEMIASSTVQVSDAVRDAILESDTGAEILYHLASEEEYAQKLSAMPTAKALKEIGKLEARFERKEAPVEAKPKAVARQSKAPSPISPIRGTGSAMDNPIGSDGEFHGSYQAWKEARRAGRIR